MTTTTGELPVDYKSRNWTYEKWAENDLEALTLMAEKDLDYFNILASNHYDDDLDLQKDQSYLLRGATNVPVSAKTPRLPNTDKSNWTYQDYAEKDPKGFIALMENEPNRAKILIDNHYGVDD